MSNKDRSGIGTRSSSSQSATFASSTNEVCDISIMWPQMIAYTKVLTPSLFLFPSLPPISLPISPFLYLPLICLPYTSSPFLPSIPPLYPYLSSIFFPFSHAHRLSLVMPFVLPLDSPPSHSLPNFLPTPNNRLLVLRYLVECIWHILCMCGVLNSNIFKGRYRYEFSGRERRIS